MVRALVLRGAAVGALGGMLAYLFAWVFAEPSIQASIDYEAGRSEAEAALAAAAGEMSSGEDPELFSRAIQGNVGLGVGMIAFGVAVGLFFAVAFCMAYGRTGNLSPRPLALLVALSGFLTLFLVPFVKYPANPPAVGNHDTIRDRAALWLLMVVVSVVCAVAATWLGQRLQPRLGTWNATLLACAAFVIVIGAVMAALPALGELSTMHVAHDGASALTETPQPLRGPNGTIVYPGFDADVLWRFRVASIGAQAILWAAMGLAFAPLAERVFRAHGAPTQQEMTAGKL
jgi:hypothetical protein